MPTISEASERRELRPYAETMVIVAERAETRYMKRIFNYSMTILESCCSRRDGDRVYKITLFRKNSFSLFIGAL